MQHSPGNQHIPPWENKNHLQTCLGRGYVSSQEGINQASPNHTCLLCFWSSLQYQEITARKQASIVEVTQSNATSEWEPKLDKL